MLSHVKPPTTVLYRTQFASHGDLRAYLHGISKAQYDDYRAASVECIGSDQAQMFSGNRIANLFLEVVVGYPSPTINALE